MASREKQRRIDSQWQTLQPSWGKKDYDGERKMLHDTLDDDENIERLSSCGWKVLAGSPKSVTMRYGLPLELTVQYTFGPPPRNLSITHKQSTEYDAIRVSDV